MIIDDFTFKDIQAVFRVKSYLTKDQRSQIDNMLVDADKNFLSILSLLPDIKNIAEAVELFLKDDLGYGEYANDLGFIDNLSNKEESSKLGPDSLVTLGYSKLADGQCLGYRYYTDISEAISAEIQKAFPVLRDNYNEMEISKKIIPRAEKGVKEAYLLKKYYAEKTPDSIFCDQLVSIIDDNFAEFHLTICSTISDYIKHDVDFHEEGQIEMPVGWSGRYTNLNDFNEKFDKHLMYFDSGNTDEWSWVLNHLLSSHWGV